MLRVENVATPLTAGIAVVPDNVPPAGFVPIATVTTPVNPVAGFPSASWAVTCTGGLIATVCSALVGCTAKARCVAAPGVTVTVAVGVIVMPLITAVTVFVSATVELKVPVATPLTLVTADGCVSVLPLPVAESTTVAPLTGLPETSFAVTVIVAWVVPDDAATDVGAATTVDSAAETLTAVMLKATLVAPLTPLAVAVSV